MNKTIKITIISITLIIMSAIFLAFATPLLNKNAQSDAISVTAKTDSGISSIADESDVAPYSFGRLQKTYSVNGADVYVDLDARDSIFGDDILITFKANRQVTFSIVVIFKAKTGEVNEGWIKTDTNGNRLMNSGKTSVHTIVCNMEITHNGYVGKFSHTFYVY